MHLLCSKHNDGMTRPEKNISNRSSILREDVSNDSYIPATPPKLELNIPDKLSREEKRK